jgi:hypothetical protein
MDEPVYPVFVPCVGGTHNGHALPVHPIALVEGAQVIVPPYVAYLAMIDAPERDPVSGASDRTWERYVIRKRGDGWEYQCEGHLEHLDPPQGDAGG